MKEKILNILLILSSLFGYLEWGGSNHSFMFESEYHVLSKFFTNPGQVVHPFTIIPMIGQLLLLVTLFQKKPTRALTYLGIGCIALLLLFIFFIGIAALQLKILFSTIPFLALSVYTILHLRKRGQT